MPVPAPNAQQEPVRAGVASTCTTCSVVSVRGARYGTESFTEGAPRRGSPNAPSRSTAALLERFLRRGAPESERLLRSASQLGPADPAIVIVGASRFRPEA